ncbi:hypothetical protein G9H71_17650, partial [Motilibacter sp. E257]
MTATAEPVAPGGPARGPSRLARHAAPGAGRRGLGAASDVTLVLALVAAHLWLQWRTRPAPHWGDSTEVYQFARDWPDVGEPIHHAMRLGSLIPARLAQEAFGPGQAAFYAWPVMCGVLLVASTYALGRLLAGRAAGVLAAGAVVACPVLVDTDS